MFVGTLFFKESSQEMNSVLSKAKPVLWLVMLLKEFSPWYHHPQVVNFSPT